MRTQIKLLILFISFILGCSYQGARQQYDKIQSNADLPGAEEQNVRQDSELSKADYLNRNVKTEKEANEPKKVKEETESEKKIYFGSCQLLVSDPEEARNKVAEIAATSGGYVEAIYEASIIIRVPKAQFNTIFDNILKLGEVVNKSIETYDVSEYFQDLSTRLSVAEKARERLYALLEKTTDVEERLKILKEIRRLSEEIENITLNLESIKKLIAFSRITVQLQPRLANTSATDKSTIPFSWIAGLDPFYPGLNKLTGKVNLKLGADFAVFDKERIYHAESPEGIKVRIGTAVNNPIGDAAFWQQALQYHLGKYYQTAEPAEAGKVKCVLFKSKDKTAFYFLAGVLARRNLLYVIEVVFPDEASYTNSRETILAAISKLEVK